MNFPHKNIGGIPDCFNPSDQVKFQNFVTSCHFPHLQSLQLPADPPPAGVAGCSSRAGLQRPHAGRARRRNAARDRPDSALVGDDPRPGDWRDHLEAEATWELASESNSLMDCCSWIWMDSMGMFLWIFQFSNAMFDSGGFAWIFHDFPLALSNWILIYYKILGTFLWFFHDFSWTFHETRYDKTRGWPKDRFNLFKKPKEVLKSIQAFKNIMYSPGVLYVCIYIYTHTYIYIYIYAYPSIYLSIYLSINLSIHQSINQLLY